MTENSCSWLMYQTVLVHDLQSWNFFCLTSYENADFGSVQFWIFSLNVVL